MGWNGTHDAPVPLGGVSVMGGEVVNVDDLHGWCDRVTGWGPTLPGSGALTMCFAATVLDLPAGLLFAVLFVRGIVHAVKEPFVSPAASMTYNLKLLCTMLALGCSVMLGFWADPPSPAVRVALAVVSFTWGASMIMLVVSYHRHLPLTFSQKSWWLIQMFVNVIIFTMHAEMHIYQEVHDIRGVYCTACFILALLSVYDEDQPRYAEVVFHRGSEATDDFESGFGSGGYSFGPISGADLNAATDSSPLLPNGPDYSTNASAQPQRRLSSSFFVSGASRSRYRRALNSISKLLGASKEDDEEEDENAD